MLHLSVTELAAELSRGAFSSVELTRACLDRIRQRNPRLNAFITVCEESALAGAAGADRARARGDTRPLLGIPLAHKDIFCTRGLPTTCGSRMLQHFLPPYDAGVVEKLREAGAVLLGKTNMDEFAMGSSNETSFFGPVCNPHDPDKVPGGSSGGSAAAVAGGLCPMATGTDTGGSIRQPASFCGITGFKPSYGRVSRWGMIAFASSLDQAGTLTRTAADAALMMQAMAGLDPRDSTSVDRPVEDYAGEAGLSLRGLRVGVPLPHFTEGLSAGVEQGVRAALGELEKAGAELIDIDLPNNYLSVPAYYVVAPAEASANLSRYDGVRYGYRCEEPKDLEDLYTRTRSEGFGEEVKRRILVGTYALSAGYYDAYYVKAQRIRRLIRQDFARAFARVDVIAGPTSPHVAFAHGAKADPVEMYLEDIFTIAVNLAGLPAISVPAGYDRGLPFGLHIIGPDFSEARVLGIAHQFQQLTDWHLQLPRDTHLSPTPGDTHLSRNAREGVN